MNMAIDGAVRVFDNYLSEVVVIEAHDAKEANEKAKNYGIRFVGCHRDDPEPDYDYIGGGLSVGKNAYSALFRIGDVCYGDPFNWGFEPRDGVDAYTVSSLDKIEQPYVFHALDGNITRQGVAELTEFEYTKFYASNPTEYAQSRPVCTEPATI
jgi:hypothetical protein